MVNLKPEQKLILLLSRANPSHKVLEDVKRLIENKEYPVDYDRTLKLAGSNEVLSLLHNSLKDIDAISSAIKNKLNNAYLHTLRNNIVQAEEMMRILTLLKKDGIEAIPLKGAIASDVIFGDPGLYLSSDIDILVKPSDIPGVEKVLTEAGYKKNEGISESDLLSSHYHLIFQKDRHHVEVHWNLVKRYFQIPPEFWWKDVQKTEYEGMEITSLSIERYIMYTVFRLFDHGFRPMKFFVLISEIINKYQDEIDWQKLLSFSRRYKMERLVTFSLKLLNNLFETKIPEDILKRKVSGYEYLKRTTISGIFHEVRKPHFRMFLYTFLLDTPQDFLKILARRFFPSSGEIRLRYGLKERSKKIYAYYILNPVFVLLKKS